MKISSIELSKLIGVSHECIKSECGEYNAHANEYDCDNIDIDGDVYFLDEDESYGVVSSYSKDAFKKVKEWWSDKINQESSKYTSSYILFTKFFELCDKIKTTYVKPQQKTYIMYDSTFKAYKIGKSVDPSIREKTLGAQFPNISLFAICQDNIENELHKKYSNKRIRGEWFNLSNDDLKDIMKRGFKVV